MLPVLSRAQIRDYDRVAIEQRGVPSLLLMENAGRGAAEILLRLYPEGEVLVVCGRGNNGGDGFVVARHLRAAGRRVTVVAVGPPDRFAGDAAVNLEAYLGLGEDITFVATDDDLGPLDAGLMRATVVVDALFGTGLARPIEGLHRTLISRVVAHPIPVFALDFPSGIDADTGAVHGICVEADHTATFAHLKSGLLQGPGAVMSGAVEVVGLGIPDGPILDEVGLEATIVTPAEVRATLGTRAPDAHKYHAGSVLVVAGGPGKTGAAILSALGALRGGAGLATIATFADVEFGAHLHEVMTHRLPREAPVPSLEEALKKKSAVAVGPGLGLHDEATRVVDYLVANFDGPLVLDADAISAFAGTPEHLAGGTGPRILTPHAGELARLLATTSADVEAHRFEAAREASRRTEATVVLKGHRSVIATGTRVSVCDRGDAVLGTGGSGDVLTGLVAALAVAAPAHEAAAAAVYLHAVSGERWRASHGSDRGMLAHEIAERLVEVRRELG